MKRSKETLALLLLLLLGVIPRLAFALRYPTIPVSDFASLVAFGQNLRYHGLIVPGWFWEFFNPGLPLVLSALFHIFPGDPGSVARIATALACGLLPLLPFLIWRGVVPLWVRLFAGACLAIWPGQIVFTGVVAQDNWVLLPSVALAALAVRSLLTKRATPIAAGLLYTAGVATRPEMLLVLFPLFLAAAVTLRPDKKLLATAALAASLPLLALAAYRHANTGQFSLSTAHAGVSILGSYIPGATANAWTDPYPFIASVRPDLLTNRPALLSEATHLAVREALHRPGFHAVRILSMVVNFSVTGEAGNGYWSIEASEVLPPALHERGHALFSLSQRPLRYEMAGIQGLFLAACMVGIRRRNWAILLLALVILLKYGLHAAIVAQGRYFYPATAWELLAIALAAFEIQTSLPAGKNLLLAALTVGLAFSLTLLDVRLPLAVFVSNHDVDQQRTYRFPLEVGDHGAELTCVVNQGVLVSLNLARESTQTAAIRTFDGDPTPGESASAACDLTGAGSPRPLILDVLDSYAPGGLPDRMLQRVEIDGVEVYVHDLAKDPGGGWAKIPLGDVGTGTKHKVVIEVKALRPDPGPGWGNAAVTTFQLSRP